MNKLILLAVFACVSTYSFAQSDFRPGYIITTNADTLRGFVNYHEGTRAYRSCAFKRSKEDQATTYEPDDINGYGIDRDRAFESRQITTPDQSSERVFLEVLLKGVASLYKVDAIFFADKPGHPLYYLINKSEVASVDGKRVLRSDNQHIAILNMLLFDCVELRPRIQKIRLQERALTDLIQDYNTCMGSPAVTYKVRKPWTKFTAGLSSGANISSLDFEPNGFNDHLTGTFVTAKSPILGLSVNVSSPRLSERFSFNADLLFTVSKYYNFRLTEANNTIRRNYTTIEITQLKLPIGIRYTFPERELRPYLNAGVSNTLLLRSSSSWVLELESDNVVQTFQQEALIPRKNQLGMWGGFGATKSLNATLDAFIELRYEQTEGLSESMFDFKAASSSKVENIQILIGIKTK